MKEPKNWFEFQAARMLPKPAYRRPPPSKGATVTASGAVRLSVRDVVHPRPAPIEVTESEASDSMILRAFKFWQR